MRRQIQRLRVLLLVLIAFAIPAWSHPLGNMGISHYSAITIERNSVEILYILDLAEIPTFQEKHLHGINTENGHESLRAYINTKADAIRQGLQLQVDDRILSLESVDPKEVTFPAGETGFPTMRITLGYRARLSKLSFTDAHELRFSDRNYRERSGWKEIIAAAGEGITVLRRSVPEKDKSARLSRYPTDLLSTPPQVLEASLSFSLSPASQEPSKRPSKPKKTAPIRPIR